MRGKVVNSKVGLCGNGITPAYAGKRRGLNEFYSVSKDHPRLCGEKSLGNKNARERQGSPPPMRGKEKSLARPYSENRITPAYAGKSAYRRCQGSWA